MEESKSMMSNECRVDAQNQEIESLSVQIRDLALSINSLKQRFFHQSEFNAKYSPSRGSKVSREHDFGSESTCLGSNSSIRNHLPAVECGSWYQKGSGGEYIENFEVNFAKIQNQSEDLSLRLFLRGLQPQIRNWVRMMFPSTYHQVKYYALNVEIVTSFRADSSVPKTRQTWSPNSNSNKMAQAQLGNSAHRDQGPINYTVSVYPRNASQVEWDESLREDTLYDGTPKSNGDQKLECVKEEEFKKKLGEGSLSKLFVELKKPNQSAIYFAEHELFDGSPEPNEIKDKPSEPPNYSILHNTWYAFDGHKSPNSNNLNSQLSYSSDQLAVTPKPPLDRHISNYSKALVHQMSDLEYRLMAIYTTCWDLRCTNKVFNRSPKPDLIMQLPLTILYADWGRKPPKPPDYTFSFMNQPSSHTAIVKGPDPVNIYSAWHGICGHKSSKPPKPPDYILMFQSNTLSIGNTIRGYQTKSLNPGLQIKSHLINLYSKYSVLESTNKLLWEHLDQICEWNLLITQFAQNSFVEEALLSSLKMHLLRIMGNKFLFSGVLTLCLIKRDCWWEANTWNFKNKRSGAVF